eukprot:m.141131 g.141131  ORF g.141131 m.141131 type:complete len:308 (-) comp14839_c0_seq5:1652-2575(-)
MNLPRFFIPGVILSFLLVVLYLEIFGIFEISNSVQTLFKVRDREDANGDTSANLGLFTGDVTPRYKPIVVPLVTGCGRSGTHSVAAFLNNIGIWAIHEGAGRGAVSVSWWYAVNGASNIPEGVDMRDHITRQHGLEFRPVIHLVRDPLDVITSISGCFCAHGNLSFKPTIGLGGAYWDRVSFEYVERYIEIPKNASRVLKATLYWLHWNRHAAKHASQRLRLEGLRHGGAVALIAALQLRGDTPIDILEQVNQAFSVHDAATSHRKGRITWAQLSEKVGRELATEVRLQAVKWGYDYYDFKNMGFGQ